MSEAHPSPGAAAEEPRGVLFWGSFGLGWVLIGFGVWTVLQRAGATRPVSFAAWFLGLTVVHDLAVSPALSLVAGWIGRRLPGRAVAPVLGGAIVSGAVILIALPPLLGDPAGNASLLPRNYLAGLGAMLATIWAVVLVLVAARWRKR